jgi:TetR/AcrR family transcriptional repressor of bet genes
LQVSPRPRGREAVKAWNRQKIIDATLDVITAQGIAGLTIARVVELAGVSMGLVNAHFTSKQVLLREVLAQMAREYSRHWRERFEAAPEEAAARLSALLQADLDPAVLNQRTLGVWFAFRAQARARPEYLELIGTRERDQTELTIDLLRELNRESGAKHDPVILARILAAMLEGLWTDYFLYPEEFDSEQAQQGVFLFLQAMYPGRFGNAAGN